MISKAKNVLHHAYAPYSQFHVACCIQSEQNNFYTGVNMENSSYNLGLCAESSALAAMINAGETRIRHAVIMAHTNELCAPCGACRQRLYEFSLPDTQIHLCNDEHVLKSLSIQELLPFAFQFKPQ